MPSSPMMMYCTLLARMVPLLFIASGILVGIRFIHDSLVTRNRALAGAAMIGFTLLALGLASPYIIRTSALTGAELACKNRDWDLAARRFQVFDQWGGTLTERQCYLRGVASLQSGDPVTAAKSFQLATKDPTGLYSLPAGHELLVSYYRQHRYREAIEAARLLPVRYAGAPERDYIVGRIAERSGHTKEAAAYFERSLTFDKRYFPSLYHLVRLAVQNGDEPRARMAIDRFQRANSEQWRRDLATRLASLIDQRKAINDVEFF